MMDYTRAIVFAKSAGFTKSQFDEFIAVIRDIQTQAIDESFKRTMETLKP